MLRKLQPLNTRQLTRKYNPLIQSFESTLSHHESKPDLADLSNFFNSHGLIPGNDYKEGWYIRGNVRLWKMRECPFCGPHKNDVTNMWVLGVFNGGGFNCFRCTSHGSWDKLASQFINYGGYNVKSPNEYELRDEENAFFNVDNSGNDSEIYSYSNINDLDVNKYSDNLRNDIPLLNKLKLRGLSNECIDHYNVGMKTHHLSNEKSLCYVFPMKNIEHQVKKLKLRSEIGKRFIQIPNTQEPCIFGFNEDILKNNNSKVVITEGEIDAMSIYEATDGEINAISLPNGCSSQLDTDIIHHIKQKKIIIFGDLDESGQQGSLNLQKTLASNDCEKVQIVSKQHICNVINNKNSDNIKDANDVLRLDKGSHNLREIINSV